MYSILDGRGKGFRAGVNEQNQLIVRSINVEQRLKSTVDQRYYEATTGQVTLTTANETGIIYVENTGTEYIVVDRVFYDVWETTGGSGSGILKYYVNPTYTGGTAITPTNTNFGSPLAMVCTALKSLTTISGTVWWTAQFLPPVSVALEEGRIMIPPTKTFGISVQAPTGNTSMKVSINVAMYNFDIDLV